MSQDSRGDLVPSILEGIQDSRWRKLRSLDLMSTQDPWLWLGNLDPGPESTLDLKIKKQILDPRTLQGLRNDWHERLFLEKYLNETILKSNRSKLSFNLSIN